MFSTNKRKTSRKPETTNGEKKKREPQTLIRSFFVGKKKKGREAGNDDDFGRSKELERKKKMGDRVATTTTTTTMRTTGGHHHRDEADDALRLDDDDYGMMQLKEPRGDGDGSFEEDDIATDSELDEALNREEALRNSSLLTAKKDDDDDDDADEIQSTKTKTISTRELILKRKENVEELMRLYEQTYYDLIETMRKRHRKFQLKNGHAGLKSAATASANARGVTKASNKENDDAEQVGEGDEQQQQQQQQQHNGTRMTCSSETCEKNAMPFSKFCFKHIILDTKQRFYEVNEKSGKVEWRVKETFNKNMSSGKDDTKVTPEKDANEENMNAEPPATDPKPLKEMSPGLPGGTNPNAATSPGGADMSLAASLGLI